MMLRAFRLAGCLALTTALLGCPGPGTDSPDEQAAPPAAAERPSSADLPESVRQAVAVARDIEADPDDVDAILERHGLTAEKLEDLMYQISSDPELSKAYNAALGL